MSAAITPPAAAPRPDAATQGMDAGAGAALEWTFNPWRQNLPNALLGTLTALGIMVLITGLGLPPLAAGALALVFLGAVQPALVPARCRVDEEGVARRLAFGWERRPWSCIRRARVGRNGLFVSPLRHSSVLASFRGLWLPVPPAAPPTLVAELRLRLAQHGL